MSIQREILRLAIGLTVLAAAVVSVAAVEPAAQPNEDREVLAVAQRFFDSMRSRDTATMRSLFDPGARLVGIRRRANGEEYTQSLTVSDFAGFVARDPRPEWTERAWNPEVRVNGTLATIWAEYDFHFGQTFSHCGIDAVQLLKGPDGWRIVSIADTYTKDGCPSRPPPSP